MSQPQYAIMRFAKYKGPEITNIEAHNERSESASQTGRDHIPPRIFKEMTHLTQQRQKLDQLLTGIGPFNSKKRAAEISELLDGYIPAVEKMRTQLKKYSTAFTSTKAEAEISKVSYSHSKGLPQKGGQAQSWRTLKIE